MNRWVRARHVLIHVNVSTMIVIEGDKTLNACTISAVPAHVLEQIDEVINDVAAGAGTIPQDLTPTAHSAPSIPVQLVPLTQSKPPTQHMITGHHPYSQQQQQQQPDWSNYQQQPTLNIAAMRGPTYPHYHSQPHQPQQQQHHDLLPATTNVINTAGVPQHEQQQIVAERISSILSSAPHDQQQQQQQSQPQQPPTTVSQASIQIKRAWTMNPHPASDSHYLGKSPWRCRSDDPRHAVVSDLFLHPILMTIAAHGDGEFKVIKINDQKSSSRLFAHAARLTIIVYFLVAFASAWYFFSLSLEMQVFLPWEWSIPFVCLSLFSGISYRSIHLSRRPARTRFQRQTAATATTTTVRSFFDRMDSWTTHQISCQCSGSTSPVEPRPCCSSSSTGNHSLALPAISPTWTEWFGQCRAWQRFHGDQCHLQRRAIRSLRTLVEATTRNQQFTNQSWRNQSSGHQEEEEYSDEKTKTSKNRWRWHERLLRTHVLVLLLSSPCAHLKKNRRCHVYPSNRLNTRGHWPRCAKRKNSSTN